MSSYKHSAPSKSKGGAFLAVAAGLVLVLAVVCFVLMQGGNKIGDVAVLDNVLTDLDRDGLQGAVERIIDQNPITEEIGVMDMSSCLRLCLEYSVHINPGKERIDSPNRHRDQKCRAK